MPRVHWVVYVFAAVLSLGQCLDLFTGDTCKLLDGRDGVCKPIEKCNDAKEEIKQNKRPTICSFDNFAPIVCCPQLIESKAQKMCKQYSQYVFELVRRPTLLLSDKLQYDNRSRCAGGGETFIIGGEEAKAKEFPHMALVGYGEAKDISWWCGGSLISLRFVMTAGHCLKKTTKGEARWVRVGDLNIKLTTEKSDPQDLAIVEKIPSPDYKPPAQYNDIALLRLEKDVEITDYVRPACINTKTVIDVDKAVASGWGLTDWGNSKGSDMLMKVRLDVLPTEDCSRTFSSLAGTRRLREGINGDTMLCAGEKAGKKDTCQGDSGGPLQYILQEQFCMYNIIGITSFGASVCGAKNSPAVYTRVSKFVPWIESIVWPDV